MAKGVEITLPDGTVVTVVPNTFDDTALMTVDDVSILVKQTDRGWDVDLKDGGRSTGAALSQTQIREVDVQVDAVAESADLHRSTLRTCIVCNGQTYCMTGGCGNTPCGWICG